MYTAPTVDSDIHVHSIKVKPQWALMPACQDGSSAEDEKRQGAFFKEQLQIASNQGTQLTKASGETELQNVPFFFHTEIQTWYHYFLITAEEEVTI